MRRLILLFLPAVTLLSCAESMTGPSDPSDLTTPFFPFLGIGSFGTIQVNHATLLGTSGGTASLQAQFLNRDEQPVLAENVLVNGIPLEPPPTPNSIPVHMYCCLPLDFDGSPIVFTTSGAEEVFDLSDTVPELTGPTEVLDIRDGDTLDLEGLTIRWNGRGADTAFIWIMGDSTRWYTPGHSVCELLNMEVGSK